MGQQVMLTQTFGSVTGELSVVARSMLDVMVGVPEKLGILMPVEVVEPDVVVAAGC